VTDRRACQQHRGSLDHQFPRRIWPSSLLEFHRADPLSGKIRHDEQQKRQPLLRLNLDATPYSVTGISPSYAILPPDSRYGGIIKVIDVE
jgi:hypothetical protein